MARETPSQFRRTIIEQTMGVQPCCRSRARRPASRVAAGIDPAMQTLAINRYVFIKATSDLPDAAFMFMNDVGASGEIVCRRNRAAQSDHERLCATAKDIHAAVLTPEGQVADLYPIIGRGDGANGAISNLFDQWLAFERSVPDDAREGRNTCLAVGLHPPHALFQFVGLV
jgi:hypothetical protein